MHIYLIMMSFTRIVTRKDHFDIIAMTIVTNLLPLVLLVSLVHLGEN